jgi:transcriptional regulator with XRE-family HTH domain
MKMQTYRRIKLIRESKNFTQEYMAEKLGISQNAYSKIEAGHTRLTTDRAEEISKILEIPIESLLTDDFKIFNIHNNTYGYIDTLQEENKDLIQSLIKQNEFLQKEVSRLIDMVAQLSGK